ncbi:hypothetical protein RRG08_009607 [Elysia crispata]|uniref:Uncharacterized protein n=1 Tax=Elysia crispata TaxID=231223 RepID=A0AAE0XTH8_9GAST|nr:hypothetical protein RRG08_009607 [Elysia crispata]
MSTTFSVVLSAQKRMLYLPSMPQEVNPHHKKTKLYYPRLQSQTHLQHKELKLGQRLRDDGFSGKASDMLMSLGVVMSVSLSRDVEGELIPPSLRARLLTSLRESRQAFLTVTRWRKQQQNFCSALRLALLMTPTV